MRNSFVFIQPKTLEDAAAVYREEESRGKTPVYWGGGTEILSMARQGKLSCDAGIDLKLIPEVSVLNKSPKHWQMGAGISLNALTEKIPGSYLGDCFSGVADHTIRNRLTLGGNLCGRLPYRESMVPLLTGDATARLYGAEGGRSLPLRTLAPRGRMLLKPGEFLVSLEIETDSLAGPYTYVRRTGTGAVAYPIMTLLLRPGREKWTAAHSGLMPFPGWAELSPPSGDIDLWASGEADELIQKFRSDTAGSGDYRRAVLTDALAREAEKLLKEGL